MQTKQARQEGEDVWLPDIKSWSKIVETRLYHSYTQQNENGPTVVYIYVASLFR